LFYLPSGRGWREGVTVGAAMNGRGAVEIVVAGIGLEAGIITTEIFSILVFMAISTTASVPLLLKWGTEWLRGRGELERGTQRRTGTILVGAGPFGRLVAGLLPEPVVLIDVNRAQCEAAEREGLPAICGDALDEDVLRRAGAADVRSLIALTANAEVNVLTAQLGRDLFGIPETQVALPTSSSDAITAIVADIGARRLFGGGADVGSWDQWLGLHGADLDRITIPEGDGVEGHDLIGAGLPLVIDRDDDRLLYTDRTDLQPGDVVTVLRRASDDEVVSRAVST
jgi:hypothetical protein